MGPPLSGEELTYTLRKLYFHFLSYWMGYDRGYSFHFDFLNQMEIHLVQKSKGKLSPRSYPIQYERKWKYSFVSAAARLIAVSAGTLIH